MSKSNVHESSEPESPVLEGTVTCSECQAINPGGTAYCAECGTTLAHSTAVPGSQAAARLRQETTDAFKRAHRWINVVSVMYRFGAFAYAVATVFAILALARTEVPEKAGVLVVGLMTLLSVLFLMGALHILFKPFVWTVVIAVLATAISVVHYIGPNPLGLAFAGSAAWAALAWAALAPTFWFQKWIARHKDLYILHHASAQTRRSLRGRTPMERHERLLKAMRRAARRTWKLSTAIACGITLASALGTYVVLTTARPKELSPALASFEAAWNAGDFAAVSEHFDPRIREVETTKLMGLLQGHGWRDSPPSLSGGSTQEEDGRVLVDYSLAALTVGTSWMQVGQEWFLIRVTAPAPPFEPMLERFQEAWRSSEPQAVAHFFAAGAQVDMLERIATAVSDRGWVFFPEILDAEQTDYTSGQATAIFKLEKGELTTEWHFRTDGTWRMHGLKFPKR